MFGALYAADGTSTAALIDVAREFSPRIERCGPREVTLDLSGLTHLFGDARAIGTELRRTAADRGLRVRVAIAGTRTAARLFVHHRAGLTVIEPGTEAEALAPLPLMLLARLTNEHENGKNAPNDPNDPNDLIRVFRRWGLSTLGELAALPPASLAARLGQDGVGWQRLARGEDDAPLVPAIPEERFEQALDLEWPIEGLEPLSFVLGRLMDPLSAHLERRGRGAAVLHVRLHLVTREMHERSLQLPAPMRDARTLRTLALLDLESHPPSAAIDRVMVAVDPTPGRIVQFSLLTRPLPSPEQLSTLNARLTALMGEGRCGSPVEVDTWQPGAFETKPFAPSDSNALHSHDTPRLRDTETLFVKEVLGGSVPQCAGGVSGAADHPVVALRRFRTPLPVRVRVEHDQPSRVSIDRRGMGGGQVETCAGPWRTSGSWWDAGLVRRRGVDGSGEGRVRRSRAESSGEGGWDRDEWDVTLSDGATYRIFRDRHSGAWAIEGIVD
jgi:protein ImuB